MTTVIQITISQLLASTTILISFFGGIQWLTANWIKTRLEKSIQHEYDKKLEDYRFSQIQRQKAETIATFFAKWIKYRGKEKNFLDDKELINYYEELNKMSLEISLWIKDEKVLSEIMSVTQLKSGTGNIRKITAEVRKLILDKKYDNFDFKEITLWPTPDEMIKLFKLDGNL